MGLFRTRDERLADRAARQSGASSDTWFEDLIGGITGSDTQEAATQAQQDAIVEALRLLGYDPSGRGGKEPPPAASGPVSLGLSPFQEYMGAGSDDPISPDAGPRSPLDPYIEAGTSAIGEQANLLGLNGPEAQAAAITALESSPMFTSMLEQG